jgi:uncharacterized protein (TIGR03000 family)
MYSVVLMMAMSGGAEAPEFGGRGCNGCAGGGCHGVASGCHGGCRGGLFHRDRGCHGCSGSACHGGSGCHGCRGGLFGGRRCHGGNGCHGGCVGSVGCTGGCGGVIMPPAGDPKTMPKGGEPKTKTTGEIPATIIVSLPADAKLTFDGNVTNSTSARRTFTTPALDVNGEYVYTLRAEIVREGRSIVETQQVTVRGGQTSEVPFNFTSQGVASR